MATLNIGMIVKNEEKRLRATLEALQSLRNAVDCRLIIADTGSNDGTVAIAQEFADIFLQITWENDFAKARNATLAEAKGDWFFYLDADEVLTEPEELIQFLNNTKLQKKYRSITLEIHNLVSEKRDVWKNFSSTRIFRIEPNTYFEGAIHEFYPRQLPFYELKRCHLKHYGYNNDDTVFMQQKSKRNLAIFDARVAQEIPDGSRGAKLLFDYAESLALNDERKEQTAEIVRRGIALLLPLEISDSFRVILLARGYSIMMSVAHNSHRPTECLQMGEEYFNLQPERGIWDMDIYGFLGYAQMKLEDYAAAIENIKVYLQLAQKEKPQELMRNIIFTLDGMENWLCLALVQSYLKLHDYAQAWTYLEQIKDAEVEGIDITAFKWQMALDHDSAEHLPKLYHELREDNREMILQSLPHAICQKDSARQQDIAAGLRQIVHDDEKTLLPLLALVTGDAAELRDCLQRMGEHYFPTEQGAIIRQCLKLQIPMNELLPHLDKPFIDDYMMACQRYYNDWLNWAASYYAVFKAHDMTLSELWFARYLLNSGISNTALDPNLRLTIWQPLLACVGKYLRLIYQPVMLAEQRELLPPNDQFVLWAEQAEKALTQKDYAQAIHNLREGVKVYPAVQAVVERKLSEIEELADPIGAEMKRLAITVKAQIRQFIAAEQLTEAESLINELAAIIPDDPDIPYLLEQVQPADMIWN